MCERTKRSSLALAQKRQKKKKRERQASKRAERDKGQKKLFFKRKKQNQGKAGRALREQHPTSEPRFALSPLRAALHGLFSVTRSSMVESKNSLLPAAGAAVCAMYSTQLLRRIAYISPPLFILQHQHTQPSSQVQSRQTSLILLVGAKS